MAFRITKGERQNVSIKQGRAFSDCVSMEGERRAEILLRIGLSMPLFEEIGLQSLKVLFG